MHYLSGALLYMSFTHGAQVQYISTILHYRLYLERGALQYSTLPGEVYLYTTILNFSPKGGALEISPISHYNSGTIWQSWKRAGLLQTNHKQNCRNLLGYEDKLPRWSALRGIWHSPWARWLNTMALHLICGNETTISRSWVTLHKRWALGVTPEEVDKYITGDLQVLKLLQHYRKMSLDPGKVFDFRQ